LINNCSSKESNTNTTQTIQLKFRHIYLCQTTWFGNIYMVAKYNLVAGATFYL